MSLPDTLPEGAVMIFEAIEARLMDVLGLPADAASQVALEVLRQVLESCGGEYFYVPKDIRLAAHGRDAEVWREFNGHNQRELARKYSLTLQYIYRIIARQREKDRKERQPELAFGFSDLAEINPV